MDSSDMSVFAHLMWRPANTAFALFLVINGSHLSLDGDFLNIAIVANPSAVGRIWLGALPGGTFYTDPNPYLWQFINPTQFSVGSNKFGVLDITERRQIAPSFIDMMGFTPVCECPVPHLVDTTLSTRTTTLLV